MRPRPVLYETEAETETKKWSRDLINIPGNVVQIIYLSNVRLMAIFSEVTENECITSVTVPCQMR